MNTKYIITTLNNKMISAKFENDICVELTPLNGSSELGNIYIGRVENVVKNMNCAFVEISKGVKCYYPLDRNKNHFFLNRKNNTSVNQGDSLLVQVCKEPVKTKPATVSSVISLTGRFLVLSTDVSGVAISGKTSKNAHCKELKELLLAKCSFDVLSDKTDISKEQKTYGRFGFILRTNSALANDDEVLNEAAQLTSAFREILLNAIYGKALTKLYSAPPSYIEEFNNIKISNGAEIITDIPKVYDALNKMGNFNGEGSISLRLYEDNLLPLSALYSLNKHINEALNKKIWLKCGGYIVIEQTEALTVIDVNSGKCVSKKDDEQAKENSVFKVNIEASTEIARQLRLRNLSGIVIIDFINMSNADNIRLIQTNLNKLLKEDCVSARVVDMTKLGLVEVTRQRNGRPLSELMADANEVLVSCGDSTCRNEDYND